MNCSLLCSTRKPYKKRFDLAFFVEWLENIKKKNKI
jgi:hypothetical protein